MIEDAEVLIPYIVVAAALLLFVWGMMFVVYAVRIDDSEFVERAFDRTRLIGVLFIVVVSMLFQSSWSLAIRIPVFVGWTGLVLASMLSLVLRRANLRRQEGERNGSTGGPSDG